MREYEQLKDESTTAVSPMELYERSSFLLFRHHVAKLSFYRPRLAGSGVNAWHSTMPHWWPPGLVSPPVHFSFSKFGHFWHGAISWKRPGLASDQSQLFEASTVQSWAIIRSVQVPDGCSRLSDLFPSRNRQQTRQLTPLTSVVHSFRVQLTTLVLFPSR